MADNKVFETVNTAKPQTSNFDLAHERKYSGKFGLLMPSLVHECVPGDYNKLKQSALVRLAPQKFPTMHRIDVYCHTWFVPYRLCWSGWEEFITGGKDGNTTITPPDRDWETLLGLIV